MALFGTTLLGKCSKLIRFDSMTLTDAGATGFGLDPEIAVPILAAMAVVVPTGQAVRRWWNDGDGDKPELDMAPGSIPEKPSESVVSIFQVLADARNGTASGDLDAELADLMDEPDWGEVNRRLDDAVKKWCQDCDVGAGNPLDETQMFQVLLSLVRNVREAPYRDEFADHYRRIFSVDRRDRSEVDGVFTRLEADVRRDAPGELDVPEYLDFRGNTPTDIEATLRQMTNHNLVILGEPGSGKSTLLRYLALSCAQSEAADPLLPVFLPLRAYAGGDDILIADSALTFAEGALQGVMPDGFFEDALSSGRCLVCLDALDEVREGEEGERYDIIRKVERLAGRYPDSRFIVTSRLAGYDETPLDSEIFTRYVAEPMDDDGIAAFIDWRFGDDPRAQNLRDVLAANPSIKSLVSNPLLMAILNMVYRNDNQETLPLNRAKFYEQAVEFLVEDKNDEALLTATALFLHNENLETIPNDELEDLVEDFLLEDRGKSDNPIRPDEAQAYAEAEAFIERAERRTGLLVEQDPGSGVFRFVHPTFREYLTAKDIHNRHRNYRRHREECWEEIKDHLTDPRWREVILLLLGGLSERYCTYLTKNILKAGDESPLRLEAFISVPPHLQLAADALANQAPMSLELQQDIVRRMEPEVAEANLQAQLHAEVMQWYREGEPRAANLPSQEQMFSVSLSLFRNFRESSYRERFADHYRQLVSVDCGDRSLVDDVFIRLKADVQRDAPGELDVPEYLNFHGDTPTEIEATLRQSNNLVILGQPGSGKSTLLRHLAASCAQSESADALLPVFLPLRDYAGGEEYIIADRAAALAEFELQIRLPGRFFEDALGRGRCLVCLDALDEVPAWERFRVVREVEQLTRRYPNSRFIVTSRIAGYDEGPLDSQLFTRYVAEPMDDAGIEAFIDRLCADDPERVENLRDFLAVNPSIKSLVSNPLLMSILNLAHQNADAGLPLNRASFYKEAVEFLVADGNDDEHQTIDKMLLTATAFFFHNENRETIRRRELEELAAYFLLEDRGKADDPTQADEAQVFAEAEAFIKRAERCIGLLVEQDPGSGMFRFAHATFQEYLAAQDIHARHLSYRRDREKCWDEIKDHLTDPRWREVILLLLGSLDERYCTYLTEKILAAGDETVHQSDGRNLPGHLRLAADALANEAPMSSELQQEIVERLEIIDRHRHLPGS